MGRANQDIRRNSTKSLSFFHLPPVSSLSHGVGLYQAATSGTNRLRYFCREDTGSLIEARWKMTGENLWNLCARVSGCKIL
jgi:hypothetical protein